MVLILIHLWINKNQIRLLRNSRAHFNFYSSATDRTKNTENLKILRRKLNVADQNKIDDIDDGDVVIWNFDNDDNLVYCFIMKEEDLKEIFCKLQHRSNKKKSNKEA
jgi:hypothetical protein